MAVRKVKYTFTLVRSSDMSHLGELPLLSPNLQLIWNRAGNFSFTIPLSREISNDIWEYTRGVKVFRENLDGSTTLIWSGWVSDADEDDEGNNLNVTVVGWKQYLEKRILRRRKDYTGDNPATMAIWKDFEIAYDILADMNTSVITWDNNYTIPAIFTNDGGVTYQPTPVWQGSAMVTTANGFTTHGRRYKLERWAQSLAEIERLGDIENGYDVAVHPATRKMHIYDQKATLREAHFSSRVGPENCKFNRNKDSSVVANYIVGTGADGTVAPQFADTLMNPSPVDPRSPRLGENSMAVFGAQEEQVALGDAKTAQQVQVYVGSEIMLRSVPREILSITPIQFNEQTRGRVPEPFVDYEVGDKVLFSAYRRGRFIYKNLQVRIFGMSVSLDSNGNEQIAELQLSPT